MMSGLSLAEKRRLLEQHLRRKAPGVPVHEQIASQARRTPEAVAVVSGSERLTYAELESRACRLAGTLRTLGAGPESLVGLEVERSADMVVGLLGILKTGAAYVPLDPAYPRDRLTFMAEDSRLSLLVSQEALRGSLPRADLGAVTLESTRDASPCAEGVPGEPVSDAPDLLAYVIYTSGSTGRPKGVCVTHRALSNFLGSMRALFPMSGGDTLLAVTTLSFDIAGLEIFLPLIQGARVEVVSREDGGDGRWLSRRLEEGDLRFMQATPSTWRMLLAAGWRGAPELTLLCGGEALPRDLADELLSRGKALWNLYGPTETTIWSTAGKMEPDATAVTIGVPIESTRLYVLDAHLQLVPQGVPGELYIGGAGVARGYLNRPGLTAERFLPDPFDQTPGARMYRTGDRVRARASGQLECLGRIDQQVKIRGHRIELEEIEIALRRHARVREAVVAARPAQDGSLQLAAYIVSREGGKPAVAELRGLLLELLPDYMVPSSFTLLSALPLTPSGKIDRRALPDPVELPSVFAPPRGPVEEGIAQVWSECLGRAGVGVQDNFFDVGGHSLLATQILTRVRELFDVELSLREFLDRPTVAGLAQRVEEQMSQGARAQVPPIVAVPRDGPAPLSFAQQRLWFLDQLEPASPVYNMPVCVRLEGELDRTALARSFNEIVRRHEVLRASFTAVHGHPCQRFEPSLGVEFPVLDLRTLPADEREPEARRLLLDEARRPFDLAAGPLVRACLIRLQDQLHFLLVTVHHIVADAWSLGVMVRESSLLYDAFQNGDPSPLPELAVQYADYAAWQRERLAGDDLQAQLAYWTEQLRAVPALNLPTDRPRPSVASGRGGERSRDMPAALVGSLKVLGRQERVTLHMTLMAAFQVLLHRYCGQDDFAVGMPIAGRTRGEIEGLVGLFVNTLAIRAQLSGNPDFRTVLRRVRHASLEAYAHQDLPFDQLVAQLHPHRDPALSPIFQTLFAFQNVPLPVFQSGVLAATPMDFHNGTAKFDLALFASETESGLQLSMEFSSDLFDAETVDRMLEHYQVLLEGIAADPDGSISALPLLSEAERQSVLGSGTDPMRDLDQLSDEEVEELLLRIESNLYA